MIKEVISKLIDGKPLSGDEAYGTMREIMAGEATPAQIAAYITALRIRGETAAVIAGSARAMRENFTRIKAPDRMIVDTCGTGGDGAHTFNISTTAAFVVAGAGVAVAKHGNRSVSSKSGSADVLEALGINLAASPDVMAACLEDVGIAFLFAPALHPAMKHAIGPRREIGIRTVFNVLGPLSNPADARNGVIGVYARPLARLMADAALDLGSHHLLVVHGHDGLDELTTTTTSTIAEVKDGKVREYELNAKDFGLPVATPRDLAGGDAAANAAITRRILEGEKGPKRDIVLLNAAAALIAAEVASTWPDAIAMAAQSIDSGHAAGRLARLVDRTRS